MKILYVTNARLPTEKAHGFQIMKTCEALARAGNDLTLIAPRRRNTITTSPFAYWKIPDAFPIRWLYTLDLIRFGRIGYLVQESSFALAAALSQSRRGYDAIYGRDEVVLCILWLFGFRRLVWESHDGAWNWCARFITRHAMKLVVVSNGLREHYAARGVAREDIAVIPNGVDFDAFTHPEGMRQARERLGLPQDVKIALYIGKLDGWKGTDTLLEAARFLGNDAKVAIIGGDAARIAELSKRYENVLFLGRRPQSELCDNQAAADVLVVPNTARDDISARFTSPLKLFAHMASHRPILASDLPSIREITGTDAAYLVPPDDAKALADGVVRIINDAGSAQVAERAYEKARFYDWSVRARAIGAILRRDV